ncbi:MAG: DUF2306 domain-containing protein [Anaerolineales bacterium]|nr:DUF2306 domain-containing protein [Anaerolineales bacterium]
MKLNFRWGLMMFFAFGVAISVIPPYLSFNPETFNNATVRFVNESTIRLLGLYIHIFAGGLALLIGPFQFLTRIRDSKPMLHRWMGRIYLICILLGGLSAFVIAPGMISGLVGEIGLISLATLWLWTAWNAYRNIRAGNIEIHRDWMTRNYALTFAAVTLRVWLGILIGTQVPFLETKYAGDFDALFVEVYRVVMWLSWVPNLIVAEMIIHRRRAPKKFVNAIQAQVQTG